MFLSKSYYELNLTFYLSTHSHFNRVFPITETIEKMQFAKCGSKQ